MKRALFLPKNEMKLTDEYKDLVAAVLSRSREIISDSFNFVLIPNNITVFPSFRKRLVNDFGMAVKALDYTDPRVNIFANSYIKATSKRVSYDVLRSDDFEVPSMILVNVMSFKGLLFKQLELIKEPFYNEDNNEIGSVNMMFSKGLFPFSNIKTLKSFALELPYDTGNKYSLIILLPYPLVKISDIYQKFSNVSLNDIFKQLNDDVNTFGLENVHVKLPRFRISTNLVLNKPLNDMGVYDIFQPDLFNFKRATNDKLYVSSVINNVNIDVTMVGQVNSNVTSSKAIPTPYFPMNRPFLYYIVEKTTTTVIVSGIYSKPNFY
ncbi:unnamed protein product [Arctia plantaginis]|uniref:Serpin domain-containing protein n=1 Tax=Arctia plantaginis TaxID=874455 RepID=A0A8S1AIF2_ARCPL|nr:unnamed protein product [Arctia plantaginis]